MVTVVFFSFWLKQKETHHYESLVDSPMQWCGGWQSKSTGFLQSFCTRGSHNFANLLEGCRKNENLEGEIRTPVTTAEVSGRDC